MRKGFLAVILLLGLCCVVYGQEGKGDGKQDNNIDDVNSDVDDERYFYEPCDYNDDVDCVRHFFVNYGQCTVRHDHHRDFKSKEAVYRKRQVIYLPNFNITLIETNGKITGLDGKIERFYINKKTNNLIMSVYFKGITFESKPAYFQFHRTGKEPVTTSDYLNVTYTVTLTAVIPVHSGISLKESRITAYSHTAIPPFYVGPKVYTGNKDPVVATTWTALMLDIPTAVQESLLTEAPSFFLAYLQKNICDFNIPISS